MYKVLPPKSSCIRMIKLINQILDLVQEKIPQTFYEKRFAVFVFVRERAFVRKRWVSRQIICLLSSEHVPQDLTTFSESRQQTLSKECSLKQVLNLTTERFRKPYRNARLCFRNIILTLFINQNKQAELLLTKTKYNIQFFQEFCWLLMIFMVQLFLDSLQYMANRLKCHATADEIYEAVAKSIRQSAEGQYTVTSICWHRKAEFIRLKFLTVQIVLLISVKIIIICAFKNAVVYLM